MKNKDNLGIDMRNTMNCSNIQHILLCMALCDNKVRLSHKVRLSQELMVQAEVWNP